MRTLDKAAVAAALVGTTLAVAPGSTSAAATAPYRNWTRLPNNYGGVVFHTPDRFEIWDNVRDGYRVDVRIAYRDAKGKRTSSWMWVAWAVDRRSTIRYGLKGERIFLQAWLFKTPRRSSPMVWYRTR